MRITLTLLILLVFCWQDNQAADISSSVFNKLKWPLPCNGNIEFQRIDTPTERNWLMDMNVKLGYAQSAYLPSDYIRTEPLVGSLAVDGNPDKRFFLLGTYEITTMQYEAVMNSDSCAGIEWKKPALPKDDTSWFDAIEFTRRYTEWLALNSPETIEKPFGGLPVFVRLPTEAEWEFAARGGTKIADQEQFRAPLFPMQGGIENYAWYVGQDSCNGNVKPIGQKNPNPAGLFDILGNVQEIVLEPFRLNSGGRLHGQAGGFIARGGSCITPVSELSTAYRSEHDFFAGRPRIANKPSLTGFRVSIAASAQPSYSRTEVLKEDFSRLQQYQGKDKTEKKVQKLVDSEIPKEAKQTIKSVAADFNKEMARRNRIEKRSIQSSLRAGALMVRFYRSDNLRLERFRHACESSKIDPGIDSYGSKFCELTQKARNGLQMTRSIYSELVFQISEDFSINELDSQRSLALPSISASPRAEEFMNMFICHVKRYKTHNEANIDHYFIEILGLDFTHCVKVQ